MATTPLSILSGIPSSKQVEALSSLRQLLKIEAQSGRDEVSIGIKKMFSPSLMKALQSHGEFYSSMGKRDRKLIATMTLRKTLSAKMSTNFDMPSDSSVNVENDEVISSLAKEEK